MIVLQETFHLLEKTSRKLINFVHFRKVVRFHRDRNQTVIAIGGAPLGLFSFEGADQPDLHQASWKGRFIHKHEDIKRIAIFAFCFGNKTKI